MEQKPYFVNPNDVANAKLNKLIVQWVREKFVLDDAVEVLISEVKCADPGCPDIDTYVYVKGRDNTKKYRIAKPLVYVRQWDIEGMREIGASL